MSTPKLPSELHPDYPKVTTRIVDGHLIQDSRWQAQRDFFAAHPEFAYEGTWEFRCEGCGYQVDEDHQFCEHCREHAGAWELVDDDGEPVTCDLCSDKQKIMRKNGHGDVYEVPCTKCKGG